MIITTDRMMPTVATSSVELYRMALFTLAVTSAVSNVDTEVFTAQRITLYDIHQRTYQLLNSGPSAN